MLERHNFPDGNFGTRQRTERSVAEQLKARFSVVPRTRREFAFDALVRWNVLPGLHALLRQEAPEIEAALHGN